MIKALVGHAAAYAGLQVATHPAKRRVSLLKSAGVDVVLDIGAATGGYGRELRRNGYTGRIVSFEPLKRSFSKLRSTTRKDRDWIAVNVALSDFTGEAVLHVSENRDSSSLLPVLARTVDAAPKARIIANEPVPVVRLDDIFETHAAPGERVFVKMDVQGAEERVLAGGATAIPRIWGLQLELSLVPLYADTRVFDQIAGPLREAGFNLALIDAAFRDPFSGRLLQVDATLVR